MSSGGEYFQGLKMLIPTLHQPSTYPIRVNLLTDPQYLEAMAMLGKRSGQIPLRRIATNPPSDIAPETKTTGGPV